MASNSTFAAAFPEAEFREAIRQTMRMGMPELDSEKLTWRWNRVRVEQHPDQGGRPLVWGSTPVSDDPGNPVGDPEDDGVIVDYALELLGAGDTATAVGTFQRQGIKVTLFDVDYEQVRTADYAMIGNVRYEIRYTAPSTPLFAVTMYDVYLEAKDEDF